MSFFNMKSKEWTAHLRQAVVVLAGLLLLAGCQTLDGNGKEAPPEETVTPGAALTPEQQAKLVEKRFQERWDAILTKDFAKAYEYLSPGVRSTITLEEYKPIAARGQFSKAEFVEVKCEEDVCAVTFFLTYSYGRVKGMRSRTGEKWFFQDGQAWFNFSRDA